MRSRRRSRGRAALFPAAAALMLAGAAFSVSSQAASAATCPDVQLVFARGSGERPGLGIVGTPLASSLSRLLDGRSLQATAVDYAAALNQSSAGPGATEMTRVVTRTAASCPQTEFVLGGYSQGASVTDIALGIPTTLGRGQAVPRELQPRIAAVVVFGNPLRLSGRSVNTASSTFADRALDQCNLGDPVCGRGANSFAHLTYASNGSVQRAAQFAAGKLDS